MKTQLKIILEYNSGIHTTTTTTGQHIVTYNDFHLKDQVVFTFTYMMMNIVNFIQTPVTFPYIILISDHL